MATQSAHPVALTSAVERGIHGADEGVGERTLTWILQMYCALHGHDKLRQFAKDRLYLQCASCGHESPGWMLKEAAPKIVLRGDPRRQALAGPHLVSARRLA